MTPLYPLTFTPVLKRYLWGGRRLGDLLGKPIGEGSDYAESWEIADHPQGQSVIACGPLAGTTLHDLVVHRGDELFGKHAPQPRFPLIFKLLDCQKDLSVQVHPNDAAAAKLTPPDLGKTEAWIVFDASPGSKIYAGLKKGSNLPAFSHAIRMGKAADFLHSFAPRIGDCIFIPAGTVHALGAGLLVAEIQQASDTTYRLYDWDRVGTDGKPRQLHIEQGLAAIDFTAIELGPVQPRRSIEPGRECLVDCEKFVLDRLTISCDMQIGGDNRFHIVSVISGRVQLLGDSNLVLPIGQTVLLPASLAAVTVQPVPTAIILDMYLPA
ncbi:MAG TPA: type I phosphomannose isomerase catalytic subunit [Pirellulaceae bacterium]|jgi:mannose-6-phosphate isomerase